MLRITRLTDYATVILGHMAQAPERLFSAKTLAQELSMGGATVSKVLKMLSTHQVVSSTRGAEGGYKLAKPANAIQITDVIEALEGPLAITECALKAKVCEQARDCSVQSNWQRINQVIIEALSQLTLADMIQSPKNNPFSITPEQLLASVRSGEVV